MNPKEYLTNKNFCPIPWTGLMYNFDGNVKNCIRSSAPIGNIQNTPIEQIIDGVKNTSTKFDMIINEPGARCHPCYELEKEKNSFEIISDRVFYLRELKSVPLNLYKDPTRFELNKIDVRWSNLCNFSCVYCGPEFSSRWEDELKIKIATPEEQTREEFAEYIFSHAKNLKHVYLAGGEPLLMKQNLKLLELVNPDVALRVNTNLSKVDTQIFEKICSFKNVHWIISVETMAEEYEYIRYGGNWNNFLDNLKTIQSLGHKISFNMLHFALNAMSIFKCVDYLKGLGFHNNSFVIGALLDPVHLNIRQLPSNMLNLVRNELIKRINEKPGFLLENGYQNVLAHIDQPFEKETNKVFEYLKNLDIRRKLDSSKIFKELYKENYHGQTI
jgi:sulfatase maturation enzyme AslB (radical SAM superfamily)